ncbi:MAG: type III secretion system chaperone [Puniceicoccales bacterium]|jgi:hypothetical protein|nr:type III secretion system chaperone [Puniceicoccales bacterium]
MRGTINGFLKRIGKGLGIPDLALDENNHCILLFDEKIVLNIDLDEEGKKLVTYAYIGEVPLECRELVLEKALEGNFFWNETDGGTLGIDRQSQSLVLAKAFGLPLKDPKNFEENLASFVEVVEKWITRIETLSKEALDRMEEDEPSER